MSPRARAAALALILAAGTARAQWVPRAAAPLRGPFGHAELAGVVQTPFLRDGNGPTVSGRPTVAGTLGAMWELREDVAGAGPLLLGVQSRLSFPVVGIAEAPGVGRSREAGRASMVELAVRLEQGVDRYRVHLAAGGLVLNGPEDVAPFGFVRVNGLRGAGEIGLARRLGRRDLWASVTAQLVHIDGIRDDRTGFRGGEVGRLLAGVRVAR